MFNLLRDAGSQRGVELGQHPLERLAKAPTLTVNRLTDTAAVLPAPAGHLAQAARKYADLFAACEPPDRSDEADLLAPVPDDLNLRAREIKGAAYYLDATQAGITPINKTFWLDGVSPDQTSHTHALVIAVAHGRSVETDNPAHAWLRHAEAEISRMRALEIGTSILGHIRRLGFSATCHYSGQQSICLEALALTAGIAQLKADTDIPTADASIVGHTHIHNPFLGTDFALLAITTNYALACDQPLHPQARLPLIPNWFGINGAQSGREQRRQQKRATHLSRYPMEQLKRIDRPTTVILDDEVPRIPKRAEFFQRARKGDLGEKAQQEVQRFAFKHPLTDGMMYPLRCMVPHQDGPVTGNSDGLEDAEANTHALKSLSYHLGADLTGICELPDYAWYSHGPDGKAIEPQHRYAVVMLIDQGYDTMEGASGDDWISGCQSMRGYIRGAEIAGIMAEFLRARGVASRAQTNADSQVLQIPLVLLAGLGELSRIGELVLNPFVGPRFKSVVLTTNLPLVADQPIDFGLQTFCSNCLKCARECPVNAIPFGDKVMFNGYEIWKPDVERCTRYRVTNPNGSACGRCMKTCPLNKVVTADGAWTHRVGNWLGIHARWLKPYLVPVAVWLDDKLAYGKRNPVKRWWLDLEIVNDRVVVPKRTNERDIDPSRQINPAKSPIGYYNAADNPAPDADTPVPADHKAAIARAVKIETVAEGLARHAAGKPRPAHYIPVHELEDNH